TETPTYTCEDDGINGETRILRFHAGPPSEDMAFRIVDRDWDTRHEKGFKSAFDRGILRLHFNFRRCSYRRIIDWDGLMHPSQSVTVERFDEIEELRA
ncbi:hypothetical protein H0E87_017907, partial [Populus deltoides]